MRLQEHRPLRSNMDVCLKHAANGRSESKLTRSEVIRNITANRNHSNVFENFRAKHAPQFRRIANVKKVKTGFHVIGQGVQNLTLNELKVRLGATGYHALKIGGLTFNLFGGTK